MALDEVVQEGDLRASLEALRDHLAEEIALGARCKECNGFISSPTAALAKQLVDVMVRLDSLPGKGVSAVDDLASRRKRRKSGVSDSSVTG